MKLGICSCVPTLTSNTKPVTRVLPRELIGDPHENRHTWYKRRCRHGRVWDSSRPSAHPSKCTPGFPAKEMALWYLCIKRLHSLKRGEHMSLWKTVSHSWHLIRMRILVTVNGSSVLLVFPGQPFRVGLIVSICHHYHYTVSAWPLTLCQSLSSRIPNESHHTQLLCQTLDKQDSYHHKCDII